MATGMAPALAAGLMNLVFRAASYTPPAGTYVQNHLGDPGAAGTANPAVNTQRQLATFGATFLPSITTTAQTVWPSVPANETYRFFSVWSAAVGGFFVASGTINTPTLVTAGQNFVVNAGGLTIVYTNVAG